MCCDTVNIEILDYCDITGVTVEEEKCAINISVEECFGASGTITDQDNIPRVINISINESDLTELNIQQSISDKINSLPLFVVSETDIVYYVITNRYSTTTEEGSFQNLLKYLYVTQGKGKGNYGYSSLNPILPSNLKLLATSRATLDDILNDGATQFIDLGNVGITDIVSAFNNHLFVGSESPVQDPNDDGYVIIDVIINGNPLQYLFVGEGGNYGTSGTDIAVLDNFVLLTDIQGLQSTQFIDLGEIGDTLIEDAVNSQSPCLTFQDPNDDGYVVVNTLNDGVLQQYLFVGIGGLYGDGCGVSVPLDFTAFTPPQEGFQYDDLWHVLGSGSTDSGIRATQYNQKIIHGGDIHATQFYADGGASGGFRNRGYGSTYITGNTGVVIRSSNPNNGIVRITSAAQINSEGNNSSKATVFIGRLFNNLIELANALYRGVVIDDTVDFLKKTDSTYIAQHTKPIILNRGLNKIYSWLSEIGDVEIRNGLLKLVSYGTGNSITGTPISNLGVDSQGNVIPTPLGGGGGVGFPRQNKVITFYLDDLGVTDFDEVTDEMVATYIAGLAIVEQEEFDYVYELEGEVEWNDDGGGESFDLSAAIQSGDSQPTPFDNSIFGYVKNTGELLRATWGELKSALKTYFDTLYRSKTDKVVVATGVSGTYNIDWNNDVYDLELSGDTTLTETNVQNKTLLLIENPNGFALTYPNAEWSTDKTGERDLTLQNTHVNQSYNGKYKRQITQPT